MNKLVNSIQYKNELFSPEYIAKYGYWLTISFIDSTADLPTLIPEDIVENSLTLKQSLCSKEFLIYGGCVASELSFKCYNSELQTKQNLSGAKIQFSIFPIAKDGTTILTQKTPLFTGWIESVQRDPITGCLQITAYDAFRRFQNTSVGDWFDGFVNRGVIVRDIKDWAGVAHYVGRPEQGDFLNCLAHQMGFNWEETRLVYDKKLNVYRYPDRTIGEQCTGVYGISDDNEVFVFPYMQAAVPINRKPENFSLTDALNQLCLANGSFAMVSGDGGLSIIKLMNAGIESIDNHADGTFSFSTTPDNLILSEDEYDAESLTYDESAAWGPHTFVCDPNPCLTYTPPKQTADQLYEENRYTIRNNFFIGDSDFINEYFECDEYGTPKNIKDVPPYIEKTKYNIYKSDDIEFVVYPNVCYGPIVETQNLNTMEYSVKAYSDPTIKMGTNITIYLDGSKHIDSRIISRTLNFVSDRAILAEYSANSAPYNNCTFSDDKYKTFTADMEKTKQALPTIACGGGVYKLKTCKVLSKEEYDAIKEKRDDTLYFVIEPKG